MTTTKTKLITADELLVMPEDGYRYELIRGALIRKMPPGRPRMAEFVNYVRPTITRFARKSTSWNRTPTQFVLDCARPCGGTTRIRDGAPDLAVEVKLPTITAQMWIGYGPGLCWCWTLPP